MNEREQALTGPKTPRDKSRKHESERPPAGHGTWFNATVSPKRAQSPQASIQSIPASPPIVGMGFQGIDNTLSTDAVPPDTHGAVGHNFIMVVSNDEFVVRDRDGVEQAGTRQIIDSFFDPLAPGSMVAFDPKVAYDPYTQRFYVTAMAFPESVNSGVMLAVSTSSDPGGTWNLYGIDADGNDQDWADYPSFGFNKDWIVVQANMFPIAGGNGTGSNIYVFRKNKVLPGIVPGHYKLFQDPDGFSQAPATAFSTTLGTLYMVEDWGGDLVDQGVHYGVLRMTSISGAVGSEVYNDQVAFPAVANSPNTWGDFFNCAGGDECGPQLDDPRLISTGDARMLNCLYRNGSIWCAHTIALPVGARNRAAVQYWKLSTNGAVQVVDRIDGGGNTPVDHYAWPSIAVNANNDALIGFSRFNSAIDATASYAFRSGSDGILHAVADMKAGLAGYNKVLSGTVNRWGDYSATVVDPRNDADLWTIQEYADTPTTADRWALWWGRIASASFSMPNLTSGITARFASDVEDVAYADNFTVKVNGAVQPGTLVCRNAAGAATNCSANVRSATWTPLKPLVPGQTYLASINPAGAVTPVNIGESSLAPTTLSLRASTQEQETSVAAGPRWRVAGASAAYGGSYLVDRMASSRAHFKFTAPARVTLSWYSVLGPNQGQAIVYLDNVAIKTYNGYASSFVYKYRRSFTVNAGPHIFSVVVKGLKGSTAGTDTQVAVDAFAIGGTFYATPATCASPLSSNNCLLQSWRVAGASAASGGTYAVANLPGASYYFTFAGTGVDAYLAKGPAFGKGSIYIDGVFKGTVDFYSASAVFGYKLSYRGYSNGIHTFRIIVAGSKNAASKGTQVAVDRWIVA